MSTSLPLAVKDAHAHFFSMRFFTTLAQQLADTRKTAQRELQEWLPWIAEEVRIELPDQSGDDLAGRWVQEMDRQEVAAMVLIASVPGDQGSVLRAAARHPGRILPYALFQPLQDSSRQELELAAEAGLLGVCLFPAMHHFQVDADPIVDFIDLAQSLNLVVFCHFGLLRLGLRDRLGLKSPFDLRYSDPIRLCRAAQQFPDATFVIPHLGAGFFRETLLLAQQCPNVLLDTSSSNSWVKTQPGLGSVAEALAKALDVVGPARLLFGSDSSVFPRGYRTDLLQTQWSIFQDLGLSLEEMGQIFGGNLDRILERD
jgi:hypothetical protein